VRHRVLVHVRVSQDDTKFENRHGGGGVVSRSTMVDHGWAVQYVESERTPFAYTVGLHDCGLPELLVTGVSPPRAKRLLNTVARDAMRAAH
jgi:hypothetical protein